MTTGEHGPNEQKFKLGVGNWAGALLVGDSVTLPGIWNSLHVSADAVIALTKLQAPTPEIDAIDRGDFYLLGLLEHVEAERWISLCNSAGWTSYGAIALSWCNGSSLDLVVRCLYLAGVRFTPDHLGLRPARMLRPEMRPQSGNLSALVETARSSQEALLLLIAASPVPVVIDVAESTLHHLPVEAQNLLTWQTGMGKQVDG